MRLEEAIDKIAGSTEYTYELSAYNKKAQDDKKEEEIKQVAMEREEETKKKVISNEFVSLTKLKEKELSMIADSNGIKSGLNKLLSNPAGLKMLRSY